MRQFRTFELIFRFCLFAYLAIYCLVVALLLFNPLEAGASSCCARSAAAPTLIVGDDRAQFNFGAASARVAAEPDSDTGGAVWVDPKKTDVTQTLRFDAAHVFMDRYQAGFSFSWVRREIGVEGFSNASAGIGDLRLSLGYEWVPAWTYSRWKPQVFLFSVTTIPTARSMYESLAVTLSDARGNGFYSTSLGTVAIKRWSAWDLFFVPEIHYSFPRTFEKVGTVSPGWGGSLGLGVGYSPFEGNLRLGARVQPKWDQAKRRSLAQAQGFFLNGVASCDVGLDASYLLGSNNTIMLSYTDQTWLGPAQFSNLNRIFAVNFQHRWER